MHPSVGKAIRAIHISYTGYPQTAANPENLLSRFLAICFALVP